MLLCLTSSHHNASFDLLEKLSIGAPVAADRLVQTSAFVNGVVVLATCNRFEAYLDIDEPLTAAGAVAVENAMEVVSMTSGVDVGELRSSVRVIRGDGVAEHLFAVSSGLESVILGEDEISGQVRRALQDARAAGTTSSGLERLFQQASHTARGVKNRTAIAGVGRSLVRLALELVSSRIPDWSAARVLVVGTGQYAGTTLAALRDRGVIDISVHSVSGRGDAFALRHGVGVAASLDDALTDADVVITCTSSELPVITPARLAGDRRRILVDLGLPRNIDPAVTALAGVELLDLETISVHAPLDELNAADDARALVSEAAIEFAAAAAEQQLTPAIVALREHVFGILDAEIERARRRGDADGSVETALRHLAGVLLHTPSVRARELARSGDGDAFTSGVSALFGVDVPVDLPVGEQAAREDDLLA
ncbi:MAG: glutamyl-tRNA reductase [Actinomycetota bacterium]